MKKKLEFFILVVAAFIFIGLGLWLDGMEVGALFYLSSGEVVHLNTLLAIIIYVILMAGYVVDRH